MIPRVKPRIMIPPSVPLSRSLGPSLRLALIASSSSGRVGVGISVVSPDASTSTTSSCTCRARTIQNTDRQQQNDQADQIVLVTANVAENDQRRLAERPAERREDERPASRS